MIDFHSFETFDPNGPGLGNLFGQISPFEALGIWPSGDFRLTPGAGAVPALGYYAGAAFATILLLYGVALCWRRRESAVLAGLAAAVLAYAAARIGGTPYTAAKAIEVGAPLAALVIVLPLLRRPVAWLYLLAAAGCSLLALANAPVARLLLAGIDGLSRRGGRRADSRPRLEAAARRRTRHPLHRLGAARRPGLHCRHGRSGRPPSRRRPLHRLGIAQRRPAVRRPAPPPRRAALRPLGSPRRPGPQPLPPNSSPSSPPRRPTLSDFLFLRE